MRFSVLLLGVLLFGEPTRAELLLTSSLHGRAVLLELYTSEGCSSCPRADRWLSTLKNDPRLWKSVIPVAFHVDYWNDLGWMDRFSSPRFSQRQRAYVRSGDVSTVYTPGWVVNGREWRSWFSSPNLETQAVPPAGHLSVLLAGQIVEAEFHTNARVAEPLHLHLAVTGSDLRTQVNAGENRGRELRHDFVVLGYSEITLSPGESAHSIRTALPQLSHPAPQLALVAWVTSNGDPRPLESVGGWLNEP